MHLHCFTCLTLVVKQTIIMALRGTSFLRNYVIYISSISVFLSFHLALTQLITACGYILAICSVKLSVITN